MKFLTSLPPASSVCFSFIELFFCLLALKSWENTAGGESTQSYEARFSPPAPPLSGHVPQKRRFAPIRQLLCILHIFPIISYIFINILSYKNLQPISLRILYLHIIFVFDIFTFNIFAFNIFAFDIFAFDIFAFDIFTFDHLIYLNLIYLHLIYLNLIIWYICIWYIYRSNSLLYYSKKSADVPRTSRPTNALPPSLSAQPSTSNTVTYL